MTLSATRLVAKGITMTGQERAVETQCLCFFFSTPHCPSSESLPCLATSFPTDPPPDAWSPKRLALVTCSARCRGGQKQRQREPKNSSQSSRKLAFGAVKKSALLWVRWRCRFPSKRRLRLTGRVSLTPFCSIFISYSRLLVRSAVGHSTTLQG
jgi:hypothetical protein